MSNDKVKDARKAADALAPRGGWANLAEARFDVETRMKLEAIAGKALKKAGGERDRLASNDCDAAEAIRTLIKVAEFATVRLYLSRLEKASKTQSRLETFAKSADATVKAWRALAPLKSALIEKAAPLRISHDLAELNAAIIGAAGMIDAIKSSQAHRPEEYAFCDAVCSAWVAAGFRPGFSDKRDGKTNEKVAGLFEQFAIIAAQSINAKIGPGVFRETIAKHQAALPPRVSKGTSK